MQFFVSLASVGGAFALAASASAGVIYSTNFSEFTGGDVNGQNGWATYDPTFTTGGGNFATIQRVGPTGAGNVLRFDSGTSAAGSPRYAFAPGFGSAFTAEAAAGNNVLSSSVDMYMASGQASAARQGMLAFDASGTRILTGFYVQANTGLVYLLANYNNAGTIGNFAFNTNVVMGYDQWVNFNMTWNQASGRMVVSWGANAFFVDGAAAGQVADEVDFYNTRNGSTVATTVFFDNLDISAVPAPGALALLGLAGVAGSRRRR
jgi:hypothetical protein